MFLTKSANITMTAHTTIIYLFKMYVSFAQEKKDNNCSLMAN